jgi:hypothetical protein
MHETRGRDRRAVLYPDWISRTTDSNIRPCESRMGLRDRRIIENRQWRFGRRDSNLHAADDQADRY